MHPFRRQVALVLCLSLAIVMAPMAVWADRVDREADRSLFNSEHYDFVKYSRFQSMLEDLKKNPPG